MKNQEQPKGMNWYSNRTALILVFLTFYIVIPVLLFSFKDLTDNSFKNAIWILFGIAGLCLIMIIGDMISKNSYKNIISDAIQDTLSDNSIFWNNVVNNAIASELKKRSDNTLGAIISELNNGKDECEIARVFDVEGVKDIIASALKNDNVKMKIAETLKQDSIKKAIKFSLNNSREIENTVSAMIKTDASNIDALKTAVANVLVNNERINTEIAKSFENNPEVKEAITNALDGSDDELRKVFKDNLKEKALKAIKEGIDSDKGASAIADALKSNVINILDNEIQTRICTCVQKALDHEQEIQKYRFAERVVGEICKNNKYETINVCAIKCLIDDILSNKPKECCAIMIEDENSVSVLINDTNCKQLIISYHKATKIIDVSSPDDDYKLHNGFIITIKDGIIDSINKP